MSLAITDVVMPGMDGLTLVKRAGEARPGMKVLFTSGYTDDVVMRYGLSKNDLHFIGKPFTRAELTTQVREVLDSARVPRPGADDPRQP